MASRFTRLSLIHPTRWASPERAASAWERSLRIETWHRLSGYGWRWTTFVWLRKTLYRWRGNSYEEHCVRVNIRAGGNSFRLRISRGGQSGPAPEGHQGHRNPGVRKRFDQV